MRRTVTTCYYTCVITETMPDITAGIEEAIRACPMGLGC